MRTIDEKMNNPEMTSLMLHALQAFLDNSDGMVFIKDANLVYRAANLPFTQMVGKNSPEELVGRSDFDIFEEEMLAKRYVADDRRLLASGQDKISFVEPLTDREGKPRFSRTVKYVLRSADGEILGLAGISRDITADIEAGADHQKEIAYLFNLPEDAFMAIYIDVTDWRIIGERLQEINGLTVEKHTDVDALAQRACRNVVDRRGSAYIFYRDFMAGVLQEIYKSGRRTLVMEYLRRFENGEERWVRDEIMLMTDPTNNHLCLVLTVRDIEARKREEIRLLWAAERDGMTSLLNRASMVKYCRQFLSGKGRTDMHALFMIDIDNFKRVNDTHGHQAGDRFLTHIAHTIRDCFRDSDLVGRVGGDEFIVLMKHIPNLRVVREKGQALMDTLRAACYAEDMGNVTVSIGISLYDQDADTFEGLYEKADQAMYVSKRNGKDQLYFAADVL